MVGPGGENPLGLGCCPFRAMGQSPTSPGETSAVLLRQLWLYLELLSLCEERGEKQNEPRNYLFSTTQTVLCFLLHVIISIPGFGSLHQAFSCNFFPSSYFALETQQYHPFFLEDSGSLCGALAVKHGLLLPLSPGREL